MQFKVYIIIKIEDFTLPALRQKSFAAVSPYFIRIEISQFEDHL